MSGTAPYSGRRIWTLTKLWVALRDVPEVGLLAFLGASGVAMGLYTYARMMFTPAGESFPSIEVRRDPDKQVEAAGAFNSPSIFYRIAQWKSDDKGYNIGVFDNRTRPFEYNLPTQGTVHSGPQYETNTKAKPAPM